MKLIKAIIRPEQLGDVLAHLYRADIQGLTITRCDGHGGEHDEVETYRGTTVKVGLQEKVMLDIGVSESFVEAPGDHAGLFQVRQLVLAHRDEVALAEQDVGRLMHRVGEQQPGHRAVPGRLQLGLDRGVATQFAVGHQGQERQHELVELGDRAVREDRRPGRVQADGQVVREQ